MIESKESLYKTNIKRFQILHWDTHNTEYIVDFTGFLYK